MADRPDPSPESSHTPPVSEAAAPAVKAESSSSGPPGADCPRCGNPILPGVPHVCAAAMAPTEAVSVASFAATRSQPVPPVFAGESPKRSGETAVVRVNPGAFVAASGDDLTGATISERYEVMSRLTQGGMGVVYQARHVLLDTVVALKVLLRGEEADQQRFLREARLASKINHPNTVYISDFGILPDGRTYLVMEYLKGRTLGSVLLTQGPCLDALRACRIAVQIARGLQAVHDKGIVHRDLKPDNVFLLEQDGGQDFVKIVDFGIAKAAEHGISVGDSGLVQPLSKESLAQLAGTDSPTQGGNITMAGTVMGTPGYMAPEQIQGLKQDERVDQYALGCLLYEMLVGKPVFSANGPMTLMLKHASDPLVPPRERLTEAGLPVLPESLDNLVCRLLAKEPHERFASMTELAQALEREIELMQIQRGERTVVPTALVQSISQPTVSAPPAPVPEPVRRGAFGNPITLGVAGLILIAVAMGGALWGLRQRGPGPTQSDEVVPAAELLSLRKNALALLRQQSQPSASSDPALVAGAVLGLGHSREPGERPALELLLTSDNADPVLRAAAAEALGLLGDRGALPALKKTLSTLPNPAPNRELSELRLTLGATLRKLGDEGGQALLTEALGAQDGGTALRAALLLCAPQPASLRQAIDRALAVPQLPLPLRIEALACLARLGDATAKDRLREQAGLTGANAAGSGASVTEAQISALARLAQLHDAAAEAELRTLATRRSALQLVAAHELCRLSADEPLPLLRTVAADTQAALAARQLALAGLSLVGQPIDARRLGGILPTPPAPAGTGGSERESLSQAAATAILQIVAREPSLLARNGLSWARGAYLDANWSTREAAAVVLADATGGDALRLLTALLRDGDSKVRVAAARALGRRREPEALAVLKTALGDSDSEVRREALRSLDRLVVALSLAKRGQVGAVSASEIGAIVKGLFDAGGAGEQVAAAAVLLRLADKATLEKVQGWRNATDPAMRRLYLSRVATERTEILAGLKDSVLAVRLAAAERLADLPGDAMQKEALPVLQEAVRAGGVEAVAAFALLARLGDRSLPATPEGALFAGPTADRMAAIESLARLPHQKAVPLLLRATSDPEPLVRRLVAEVAADLGENAAGGAGGGELAPGVPVLRLLVHDSDAVVRARAESLLGRLLQQSSIGDRKAGLADLLTDEKSPATATPTAAPQASPRERDAAEAPRDGGTSPDAGGATAGSDPTTVGEPAGGDGRGAAPKIKPLAAEPFARAGLAAYAAKDFKGAQKLLEKVHSLCSRDRKRASECAALTFETSLRLGQIYEGQKALPEAMSEYQKVLRSASVPKGKAGLRSEAQAAAERLAGRLGQVIVRSPGGGKKAGCDETTMWMRPGPALIKVDGKLEPIEVRAQAITKVGSCP